MSLAHPAATLIDAGTGVVLGGPALDGEVSGAAQAYARRPDGVVFLRFPVAVPAVVRYLGGWLAGRPLALLDPRLGEPVLADLVGRFEPALVVGVDAAPVPAGPPEGYRAVTDPVLGPLWQRTSPTAVPTHPDLGILLATSGSTGNPKLVRLSREAVTANTSAIVEALRIDAGQVAATTLPFFYSFGMSVLNTHLASGATVVLTQDGLVARPFWEAVQAHRVTSLAGVPYQYEMLRRLRFDPARYPALRTLTQAGGRLRPELVTDFHRRMAAVGGELYVMYGQTEAAPRMTTLPADRLTAKLGSVGPAVPGGRLSIRLEDGSETSRPCVDGEVLYRGPNVMLGYAETAADLARGDELGGLLETGDLGYLDGDGYLFLSGRLGRFAKVFGVRLNLDDIETMLRGYGAVAAVAGEDTIIVWLEGASADRVARCAAELAGRLGLHRSGFDVRGIDALPLLGNGKIDYRALEKRAREEAE
jgi:acyl-CoA synthetase (AMP-forming)/AMP-acid ligase II